MPTAAEILASFRAQMDELTRKAPMIAPAGTPAERMARAMKLLREEWENLGKGLLEAIDEVEAGRGTVTPAEIEAGVVILQTFGNCLRAMEGLMAGELSVDEALPVLVGAMQTLGMNEDRIRAMFTQPNGN